MMVILEKLGIKPIINGCGTLTRLGGNRVDPSIIDAMKEVANHFIDMNEFLVKSGEYVARLLNVPGALIVNGAGAGIVLAIAATITEGDIQKMIKLPFTEGFKNEIIIQHPHTINNPYVYFAMIPGGKLRIVGSLTKVTKEDIVNAINDKTAAILHFYFEPQEGEVPLSDVIGIAHKYGVPVIVDAAAELPPVENLTRFIRMGADLVIFSGGKDIGAPNDTGLILANNLKLLEACRLMTYVSYVEVNNQTHVFIGRTMKMSKEDIIAFIVALERYLTMDHNQRLLTMHRNADLIIDELKKSFPQLKIRKRVNNPNERIRPVIIPKVEIELPEELTKSLIKSLREGDPPIYLCECDGHLCINVHTLTDEEVIVVIEKLKELLAKYLP